MLIGRAPIAVEQLFVQSAFESFDDLRRYLTEAEYAVQQIVALSDRKALQDHGRPLASEAVEIIRGNLRRLLMEMSLQNIVGKSGELTPNVLARNELIVGVAG